MKMIKMKNLILVLVVLFAFVGCSKDDNAFQSKTNGPTTEVYVAGNKIDTYSDVQMFAKSINVETHSAYYYIRIDSRIPEMTGSVPSSNYYPQTLGGNTMFCHLNTGSVLKNFPYKYLGSHDVSDYVYDPTGLITQTALVDIPTLDDLFAANMSIPSLNYIFNNVDRSKIKIIWYVAKNLPNKWDPLAVCMGRWHVDGVLTMNTVTDVRDIPGMIIEEDGYMESSSPSNTEGTVKVDIHQQSHIDWEAIKTTIHIGAVVDSVQVSFPIPNTYICEADDFAIRTYDAYYTLNEITFNLTAEVAHEADQVVITVKDFPASVINAEVLNNPDGLTIEVWTYPRQPLASEDPTAYRQLIFNMLKQAKVKVGLDQPNYSPNMNTPARNGEMYTQVSSAFF